MSKLLWNTIKVGSAVLGASLFATSTLAAQTPAVQTVAEIDKPGEAIAATNPYTQGQQTQVQEASSSLNSNIAAPETLAQATPFSESATPTSGETGVLEQMQRYNNQSSDISNDEPMGQVTNVSQFRDVQPSDWAYEALSQIVQKYGCLQGYPDGTYRGNRALSRYEFAAGLNACLRQIEALIANREDSVSRADFERLQRLTEEFRTELATLGTRVDNLEGRTAFLEARQFSTTTKLVGEVVFSASDAFGDDRAVRSGEAEGSRGDLDINTILANRARLNFDTSFSGKDRLRVRLQGRNITPFARTGTAGAPGDTGTNMTRLGYDGNENNNDIRIARVQYRFPLTPQATVFVETTGMKFYDIAPNLNPLLDSSANGSISRFGRFNPIYRQARDGAGAALNYNVSKTVGLTVGYGVPENLANEPSQGGLFNGSYAALAQLAFRPSDAFGLGLTYVRSYNTPGNVSITGSTGSNFANQPFGNTVATSSNQFGVEATFRLSPRIVISGWGGFTDASTESGPDNEAEIWNYAVTLAFPDLGKKGNLLGLVFGMPPKVTENSINDREDKDNSYHIEGLYRYRVTDNIDITPGLLVILNPEHNENNDTIYVGTLRTTFRF